MKKTKIMLALFLVVLLSVTALFVLTACKKDPPCEHIFRNDECTECGAADPNPVQEIDLRTVWRLGAAEDAEKFTIHAQTTSAPNLKVDYEDIEQYRGIKNDMGTAQEKDLSCMNTLVLKLKGTATTGDSKLMFKLQYPGLPSDTSARDEYTIEFSSTEKEVHIDLSHRALEGIVEMYIFPAPGTPTATPAEGNFEFSVLKLVRAGVNPEYDLFPINDFSSLTENTLSKAWTCESQYAATYNADKSITVAYNKGGASYCNMKTPLKGAGVPEMKKVTVQIQGERGKKIMFKPFDDGSLEKIHTFTGAVDTVQVNVNGGVGVTLNSNDVFYMVIMVEPGVVNVTGTFTIKSMVFSSEALTPPTPPALADCEVFEVPLVAGPTSTAETVTGTRDVSWETVPNGLKINYTCATFDWQYLAVEFSDNPRLLNGAKVKVTFTAPEGVKLIIKTYNNEEQKGEVTSTGEASQVFEKALVGSLGNSAQITFFVDANGTAVPGSVIIHKIELWVADATACQHLYIDGECFFCGIECLHTDGTDSLWDEGECLECGAVCAHDFTEGDHETCSICEMECPHQWDEGVCETCDYACPHDYVEGVCSICGSDPGDKVALVGTVDLTRHQNGGNFTLTDEVNGLKVVYGAAGGYDSYKIDIPADVSYIEIQFTGVAGYEYLFKPYDAVDIRAVGTGFKQTVSGSVTTGNSAAGSLFGFTVAAQSGEITIHAVAVAEKYEHNLGAYWIPDNPAEPANIFGVASFAEGKLSIAYDYTTNAFHFGRSVVLFSGSESAKINAATTLVIALTLPSDYQFTLTGSGMFTTGDKRVRGDGANVVYLTVELDGSNVNSEIKFYIEPDDGASKTGTLVIHSMVFSIPLTNIVAE